MVYTAMSMKHAGRRAFCTSKVLFTLLTFGLFAELQEQLNTASSSIEQRTSELQTHFAKLQTDLEAERSLVSEAESLVRELQAALASSELKLGESERALEAAQTSAQQAASDYATQLEAQQAVAGDLERHLSEAQAGLSAAETDRDALSAQVATLSQRIDALKRERGDADASATPDAPVAALDRVEDAVWEGGPDRVLPAGGQSEVRQALQAVRSYFVAAASRRALYELVLSRCAKRRRKRSK